MSQIKGTIKDIYNKLQKIKLPEGLLASAKIDGKLNAKYDSKGNITINNSGEGTIVVNHIFINEKTRALPYYPELFSIEKKPYERKEAYFVREDLLPPIGLTRDIPKRYLRIIVGLEQYLDEKDIAALKFAAVICKDEDAGTKEEFLKNLRQQSLGKAPIQSRRTITIYNWVRCGEIFDNDIFPQLEELRQITKDKKAQKQLFCGYWNSMLAYHPTRIFVRMWMPEEELSGEIYERLVMREQDEVYVYARGTRIPFAKDVIKDIVKNYECYYYRERKYKLGTSQARTFIVKKRS